METSKLPLVSHFSELRNKPKWVLKLILTIVVMTLSAVIGSLAIDYNELYKDAGMTGTELDKSVVQLLAYSVLLLVLVLHLSSFY